MKRKREDDSQKIVPSSKKQKISFLSSAEDYFSIPSEVHLLWMQFLSMKDLTNVAQTCKEANAIAGTNILWKRFALEEGVNKETINKSQLPVKELVKQAKRSNCYPSDLVAIMGGIDNIMALPLIPRKEVDLIFPDFKLIDELKGHKIWRGVNIKGVVKQPYIALCAKQHLANDHPELCLILIYYDKKSKSGYVVTKTKNSLSTVELEQNHLKRFFGNEENENLNFGYRYELTDQTEFKARHTRNSFCTLF